MVFTGDEFGDGGDVIAKCLKKQEISASFFLTGNFYKNPSFNNLITQLKKEGHYLGAHSDKHLLYADWVKRDSLLISEKEFKEDLLENYSAMAEFGIKESEAKFFLPPYEWYNSEIVKWTGELDKVLINFTSGTLSTADYTFPEMGRFRSSNEIYSSIIDYEAKDPDGLNGFILLLHIGTDSRRTDKFYRRLDELLNDLKAKGYQFKRIDQLLD